MPTDTLTDRAARQAVIYPAGTGTGQVAGRYSDRTLADLARRAAGAACAAARTGRVVKGPQGRSRIAPMKVSAHEQAALSQEAAVEVWRRIVDRDPTGRALPQPGQVAQMFGGADPALADPIRQDESALRRWLLGLLRDDRPQDWRDAAVSIAASRTDAADFDRAAELVSDDLVGQAELEAADDRMIDAGVGRDPLTAETQATLYLSGLSAREQGAVRAALSSAPSAVQAAVGLAPSAAAWRKRAGRGRADLTARAADVGPALESVIEAHEGRPAAARRAVRPESLARQAATNGPLSRPLAALRRTLALDRPYPGWPGWSRLRFAHDRIRRPRLARFNRPRPVRQETHAARRERIRRDLYNARRRQERRIARMRALRAWSE
jgi:hypothetical protein